MSEFAHDHEQKTRLLAEIRRLETELQTVRQQAERAETARQAWMVIGSRADGVVDAVRAYLSRETSCLPIEKADIDALGWLVNALAFYDAAAKARSE